MPPPNGSVPQASAAGHCGSPSAFGGKAAGARIAAAAAADAGTGATVRTGSTGALVGHAPQAADAAAAPTTIAHIPTCTGYLASIPDAREIHPYACVNPPRR